MAAAAAAGNLPSQDQFLCSICLDVFTDPVSTSCGHNFCKDCITTHWNMNFPPKCPMCNEVFHTKPQLKVNTFISGMVTQFRQGAERHLQPKEAEIQQMTQKRRATMEEIKCLMMRSKNDADREIAEGVQVFMALKEFVDKVLDQVIKEIEDKQKTAEVQAKKVITELEKEVSDLKRSSTEGHSHQSFTSLQGAPPTKDWTKVRLPHPSHQGTVVRAVALLEEMFAKETKKIKKAELKRVQRFAVDVTLDPDTAYPRLILSDDGKQVVYGDVKKNLPDNPERFSCYPNVLGKESFSSGRFYFEVQVKGKTEWDLGVARASVNRKGTIILSPKDGFWTIWLRKVNKSLLGPAGCFSLRPQPEKVGVFVDYDEGVVSFHDVGTAALIFSFTGCNFIDKLHPILNPAMQDQNTVPLIICPVNQMS